MSSTYPNPQTPAPNEPIADLPEPPAGTRWVYRGKGWVSKGCLGFACLDPNGEVYTHIAPGVMTTGYNSNHYWEAVTIPTSTPMERLDAHFETQEFQDFLNLVDEALDGEPLLICKGKPAQAPSEAADDDDGEPLFDEKWVEIMNAAEKMECGGVTLDGELSQAYDTIKELRAELEMANERLNEQDELLEWKRQEIKCASKLDLQAIGQELGLAIGDDIAANILPEIKRLKGVEVWEKVFRHILLKK